MDKKTLRLAHAEARRRAVAYVEAAPVGYVVTISEPTRSLEQNATLWGILQAFSEQLEWPVNGAMVKLSAEDWKALLSAAFMGESMRLAQGLSGGVVMLGVRTSQMSKRQFSEFIEFLKATAADRGVTVYEREEATA